MANYFSDVEYKELRHWLGEFLGFLPPIMFIVQFSLLVSACGRYSGRRSKWFLHQCNKAYDRRRQAMDTRSLRGVENFEELLQEMITFV